MVVRAAAAWTNRWTKRATSLSRPSKVSSAEPPTKEEVDRAKTRLLKQIELDMKDSQNSRRGPQRICRVGRLAAALSRARRHQEESRRAGRRARRQSIPEAFQPHAGRVHSHQDSRPRRDPRRARCRGPDEGLQRRRGDRGRARHSPPRRPISKPALVRSKLPNGDAAGAAVKEDPRRHGHTRRSGSISATKRRSSVRPRGAVGGRAADARHKEQDAPADSG